MNFSFSKFSYICINFSLMVWRKTGTFWHKYSTTKSETREGNYWGGRGGGIMLGSVITLVIRMLATGRRCFSWAGILGPAPGWRRRPWSRVCSTWTRWWSLSHPATHGRMGRLCWGGTIVKNVSKTVSCLIWLSLGWKDNLGRLLRR